MVEMNVFGSRLMAMGALLLFLLSLSAHSVSSASLLGRSATSRTRRHVRGKNDADSFYPLLCPKVVCLPVPRDCQEIEMIVFEYSRVFNGKMVDVRCESCEYCLDMPFLRRRRSLAELLGTKTHCPQVSCPLVPGTCQDVRTTSISVGGRRCSNTCPACFDGTVVPGRNIL